MACAIAARGVAEEQEEDVSSSLAIKAESFHDVAAGRDTDKGLSLFSAGTVSCGITIPADGLYTFVVLACGDEAGGEWPLMEVAIDDESVLSARVSSPRWAIYTFTGELSAGPHAVAFSYPNDYFGGEGDDRNLHLKNLTVISPEGAPEAVPMTPKEYQALAGARRERFFEKIGARTEMVRKGKLEIQVVDDLGVAIPGARVRVRQKRHEFLFGVALSSEVFEGKYADEETGRYFDLVDTYFNHAVTENALKWVQMEPARDAVNYELADRMAEWCRRRDIKLRGHCIFWECENTLPTWAKELPDGDLRAHIGKRARIVSGKYRGTIDEWDVNNEMMHCTYLQDRLGGNIRRQMFHEVHAANPQAVLYVNDYYVLHGNELAAYMEHIDQLKEMGVPVGGIGVQGHFAGAVDPFQVENALNTLAEHKLPIKITEYDCADADEQVQAQSLEDLYRVAFSHPAVEGILMWSFWEKCAWKPKAAILRADFSKKPSGEMYEQLLFKEWWTFEEGECDDHGFFSCKGYFGEYQVDVRSSDGREASKEVMLKKKARSATVQVRLPRGAAPRPPSEEEPSPVLEEDVSPESSPPEPAPEPEKEREIKDPSVDEPIPWF